MVKEETWNKPSLSTCQPPKQQPTPILYQNQPYVQYVPTNSQGIPLANQIPQVYVQQQQPIMYVQHQQPSSYVQNQVVEEKAKISINEVFKLPWQCISYFFGKGIYFVGIWELLLSCSFMLLKLVSLISSIIGIIIAGIGIVPFIQTMMSQNIPQLILFDEMGNLHFFGLFEWIYACSAVLGIGIVIALISLGIHFILGIVELPFNLICLDPLYIRVAKFTELVEAGLRTSIEPSTFTEYIFWTPNDFCTNLCMKSVVNLVLIFLAGLAGVVCGILEGLPGVGQILSLILFILTILSLPFLMMSAPIFVIRKDPFGGIGFLFRNFSRCIVFGISVFILWLVPIIGLFVQVIGISAATIFVLKLGDFKISECEDDNKIRL